MNQVTNPDGEPMIASGEYLDNIADAVGFEARRNGEPDADYRTRVLKHFREIQRMNGTTDR